MSISIPGIDNTVDAQLVAYDNAQQVNSTSKTTVVEQTEKIATEASSNEVKVLNKYDRVEISAEAYQNSQNAESTESALSTLADTETQESVENTTSLIDESTLTEDDDDIDLTTLTESELRKLVSEGTITQSEANAELLRRANEEKAEETAKQTEQDAVQKAGAAKAEDKEAEAVD